MSSIFSRAVRALAVAAVCAFVGTACSGPGLPDPIPYTAPQVPDLLHGMVDAVAWLPDDWVYFAYSAISAPSELWRRPLDGSAPPERIDFRLPPEMCSIGRITALQPLSSGMLAIAGSCADSDSNSGVVAILDVQARQTRRLVVFPPFSGGGLAVLPDLTGAYVTAHEDGMCEGLALFQSQQGFRPFDRQVTVRSTMFWPDGLFRAELERPVCGETGDAGWPALTNDGKTLYFVARAAPQDRSDRMWQAEAAILQMPTSGGESARLVFEGFRRPTSLAAISRGGQTLLAVTGQVNGRSSALVIRADDGAVLRSWEGPYRALSPSPDGSRFLAAKAASDGYEFEVLDVR